MEEPVNFWGIDSGLSILVDERIRYECNVSKDEGKGAREKKISALDLRSACNKHCSQFTVLDVNLLRITDFPESEVEMHNEGYTVSSFSRVMFHCSIYLQRINL